MDLIAQGAEARVYRDGDRIVKERPAKGYRSPELDSRLRLLRLRREARILEKLASAGVPVPALIEVDERKMTLAIAYLDGPRVRDVLDESPESFGREIGRAIGKMHAQGIAHADLTTSNMVRAGNCIHLIDFGLAFATQRIEDYAVDLHLLDRALDAKHHELYERVMPAALDGYRETFAKAADVIKRLEKVEARGRYKRKR